MQDAIRSHSNPLDDLARVFNTSLVSTRTPSNQDFSKELQELMESPSFRSILNAVRQHARLHGVSERAAAEEIIQTFRKVDLIWGDYVFKEGVERIRGN